MDAAGDAWMSKERLRNAKARTNADAHERKEVKPWEEPLGRSRGKNPWEEAAGKKPRRHSVVIIMMLINMYACQ